MISAPGLLVKLRRADAASFGIRGAVEPILTVHAPGAADRGFTDHPADAVWLRMAAEGNPWEAAHKAMRQGFAAGSPVLVAEPDILQQWGDPIAADSVGFAAASACTAAPQSADGGRAEGPGFAWHLGDGFSGLASAGAAVGDMAQRRVRIAHLDTGYDPDHANRPANLLTELERNFVRGEGSPNSARDVTPAGGVPYTRNRGHGTGTISVLAGQPTPQGQMGGAPRAEVLSIRIADGVVRFTTSTMVQGIDHALKNEAQVLSMSMGGIASAALADAVNQAYEGGLTMVTAAGNNVGGLPIRSVVYPARMRRVIAATGVMADGRAYYGLTEKSLEGCWGPEGKMSTAIAGWTPNVPWAEFSCGTSVRLNGEGTSAATPQVAAAVALWIARHQDGDVYKDYPQKWMRVEAVRQALFATASRTTDALNNADVLKYLGRGALKANLALDYGPAAANMLTMAPVASADWSWIKLLTGEGVGFAVQSAPRAQALGLELMQVAGSDAAIEATLLDGGGDPDAGIGDAARKAFFSAVLDSGRASPTLTAALISGLGLRDRPVPPAAAVKRIASVISRKPRKDPAPGSRRLRVFALDPSLSNTLGFLSIKTATVSVPYETDENGKSILRAGPIGDYLEIVDVDPASNRIYDPVDLDHPHLLLSDGLEPSEGNPRFHQQMVYAIGMKTIGNFEEALGRKALWAPRRATRDGRLVFEYVPRLRIYPHALRQENAYYSPSKVALLFGYFPAQSAAGAEIVRGSMVFACLSADIVAHEMTHALLDGVHRHYQERSNPDVAAFHEGFADIVALFQHFTYKDIVSHEIAGARGQLGAAQLLGGLARQFGGGAGQTGPLRSYIDEKTGALLIGKTLEAHSRGSILVFAIYEAFLAIVELRTGDLIRLATGGSGVLPAGDLHPGLVQRLTRETCKAASQLLRICIRAIDYCPPNDITFGEYLRAIMTADLEQVPDDTLGYRTAMLQAFRKHDLLPHGLRTVSVESLIWRQPVPSRPPWLQAAIDEFKIDWSNNGDRWTSFKLIDERRHKLQNRLAKVFLDPNACMQFGLQHGLAPYRDDGSKVEGKWGTIFSVHSLRRVRRKQPDGEVSNQIVAVIAQRRAEPMVEGGTIDPNDAGSWFWFRGGATVIIDPAVSGTYPARAEIRYIVRKSMSNSDRLKAQREFVAGPPGSAMRAQYFNTAAMYRAEPFAFMHVEQSEQERTSGEAA